MPVALDTLLVFIVASTALAITPGPTMLLALSNGMSGGLRLAAFGIAGASLGSSTLILGVAVGLGSLLAASQTGFEAVRWLGVAYLAWIGWRLWRSPPAALGDHLAATPVNVSALAAFRRSLLVALSNPKAVLFFAAFLPQFIDASRAQAAQFAGLGAVFVLIDSAVMMLYAGAGARAARWLSARSQRWLHRGCAVGMGLLAMLLATWRRGSP
jgi:threonine/homoserine/homoserine lactone efflux protein